MSEAEKALDGWAELVSKYGLPKVTPSVDVSVASIAISLGRIADTLEYLKQLFEKESSK